MFLQSFLLKLFVSDTIFVRSEELGVRNECSFQFLWKKWSPKPSKNQVKPMSEASRFCPTARPKANNDKLFGSTSTLIDSTSSKVSFSWLKLFKIFCSWLCVVFLLHIFCKCARFLWHYSTPVRTVCQKLYSVAHDIRLRNLNVFIKAD